MANVLLTRGVNRNRQPRGPSPLWPRHCQNAGPEFQVVTAGDAMPNTFYILSVRFGQTTDSPTLVDWVIARCDNLADAKREARRRAETATACEWIWPKAEAVPGA